MTTEMRTRICWLVGIGEAVTIATLCTWIFTAGILRSDYVALRATACEADKVNQSQEMRLQKLELNYDHLRGGEQYVYRTARVSGEGDILRYDGANFVSTNVAAASLSITKWGF